MDNCLFFVFWDEGDSKLLVVSFIYGRYRCGRFVKLFLFLFEDVNLFFVVEIILL